MCRGEYVTRYTDSFKFLSDNGILSRNFKPKSYFKKCDSSDKCHSDLAL